MSRFVLLCVLCMLVAACVAETEAEAERARVNRAFVTAQDATVSKWVLDPVHANAMSQFETFKKRLDNCFELVSALGEEGFMQMIGSCARFVQEWKSDTAVAQIIPRSVLVFAAGDKIRNLAIDLFGIRDDAFINSLVYGLLYAPAGTVFDVPEVRAARHISEFARHIEAEIAQLRATIVAMQASQANTEAVLAQLKLD